jgi:hypothetical protein
MTPVRGILGDESCVVGQLTKRQIHLARYLVGVDPRKNRPHRATRGAKASHPMMMTRPPDGICVKAQTSPATLSH